MKNVINWFNIPSTDFQRAVNFYNNILQIEMMVMPGPDGHESAYFSNPQDGGVSGSIDSNPQKSPSADGTTVFFDVNGQMDEVLDRVNSQGGQVVMPKTSIGEFGNIAMAMDSEGNMIAFHSAE